jgi:hypothetical protein
MPAWKPNFDFYETRLDGQRALVRLDLGAVRYAPVATHPMRLQVRVKMLQPREDGLRSDGEADALFALEDKVAASLQARAQAIYVGRMVAQGFTELYFYLPFAAPAVTDGPLAIVGDVRPYALEWSAEKDSAWECYDRLFPDSHAMQAISNRGLQRVMAQQGDRLQVPRRVEHAALFGSQEAGEAARGALAKAGFQVTALQATPAKAWNLQFSRAEACDGGNPDRFVFEILDLIEPLGGDYDGWGSELQKA